MKILIVLVSLLFFNNYAEKHAPVQKVDLKKYSGVWYSLYSIPTMFDKGVRETTTTYTVNPSGYLDVLTIAKKNENAVVRYNSRLYQGEKLNDGELKAQFIWPIKVDYWIIELASDYSYVVVGHPDHRFLFIMSREKKMSAKQYQEILARCKAKGYDVSKLTSQRF